MRNLIAKVYVGHDEGGTLGRDQPNVIIMIEEHNTKKGKHKDETMDTEDSSMQ